MTKQKKEPYFLANTPKGTMMYVVKNSYPHTDDFIEVLTYQGYKTHTKHETYDEYYPTRVHCSFDHDYYVVNFTGKRGKKYSYECDSNSNLATSDRAEYWDTNEHHDRRNGIYFTTDKELLSKYVERENLTEVLTKREKELRVQADKLNAILKTISEIKEKQSYNG